MFNIKLGDKTYEGVEKVKLNTTDGGTATFIGEGSEPIKAFVSSSPAASEVAAKSIAAIPMAFQHAYRHTNTDSTLSVEFNYGNVGDTHILALAVRNPNAEPATPSGWTKTAWISPHENSTSDQWLFVATTVTTESTAGTTGTVSFNVVVGKRNYLIVINARDFTVDAANPIIAKAGGTDIIETELFENTLLICTSETASSFIEGDYTWTKADGGYSTDYLPQFGDDREPGGRLAMLYIPFTSQQPFSKLNLKYTKTGQPSTSILTCALNVTPGKKNLQYAAIL